MDDQVYGDARLMRGDCLVRMREIEGGSVDLVVCDLPYGTTQCAWDTVIPFEPLWSEYRRVLKKKGRVVLTCSQPFTSALVSSNINDFSHSLVWKKNRPSGHLMANKMPMKGHEDIAIFGKGGTYNPQKTHGHKPTPSGITRKSPDGGCYANTKDYVRPGDITTRHPTTILSFTVVPNGCKERMHPTQKPVELMEWLVRSYSNPGDMVLDNSMGSGTTGIACVNAARRFVGIEMDERYFAAACERIAAHERPADISTPY